MSCARITIRLLFFAAVLLLGTFRCAQAQEETEKPDSTADTLKAQPAESSPAAQQAPAATSPEDEAVKLGNTWLRRLLYRGWLNRNHIGAYTEYQLTDWQEGAGASGPVQARITVYYLGATTWLGQDAEWLQAVVRTMDEDPIMVEYDFVVAAKEQVGDIHRVLYRVERGPLHPGNFNLPGEQVDYDRIDRPASGEDDEISMYSGVYNVKIYRGSGTAGAVVAAYRTETIAPLSLVILAYGDQALTFVRGGSDAASRFNVPPPPGR